MPASGPGGESGIARGRPALAAWRAHLVALSVGGAGWAIGWAARATWDPEMRLWKAFGDAALLLLIATMFSGPLARLWRPLRRLLALRRATGIWFAIAAAVHTVLILNGWARWSLLRFLGFEYIDQLGRWAQLEPGFGLANLLGAVAMAWALALAITSNDRAVRRLGPQAWKWFHGAAHVVFYLVALHAVYFLFLHYTASFHRPAPPPDPLRWPALFLVLGVIVAQLTAFGVEVRRRRRPGRSERRREPADVGAS